MFQIAVTLSLGEREEDMMKGRVNCFKREHRNKGAETMEMEDSVDVPGEFC